MKEGFIRKIWQKRKTSTRNFRSDMIVYVLKCVKSLAKYSGVCIELTLYSNYLQFTVGEGAEV